MDLFLLLISSLSICPAHLPSITNQPVNTAAVDYDIPNGIKCDACIASVASLRKVISKMPITELATYICYYCHYEDYYICSNIVKVFKDEILSISANPAVSSRQICGLRLGSSCGCPFNQTWTIPVPPGKPPVKPYPIPKPGAPTNRILHISDIHWDPQYTEGLTTQCGEPLCCRPPNAKATNKEDAAGPWGDIHCDIPYRTVVNLMERLQQTSEEFDWIYMTGDLPAHNDWSQTRDGQLNILANITSLFKKYLPGKPVYFAFGNHESVPVNSFPPPFITGNESESWLYNKAADEWADWLTPEAVRTLKYGGYYAVEVHPDLKVISLQTNFCSEMNWWLLINSTDPGNMLKWLTNELLESEIKGQKVHIIGHIPSNDKPCIKQWSTVFHNISLRFESTIAGYFYGHVHSDRFFVFHVQEENSTHPFGVGYLVPSVTGYGFHSAAYRIYEIDGSYNGSSRTVLDHSTYIMNITHANLGNEPKWVLEYTAKDAFNLTSLSPEEWSLLIDRFEKDDRLFQKYNRYYSKSSETNECTGKCKTDRIRFMKSDISYEPC